MRKPAFETALKQITSALKKRLVYDDQQLRDLLKNHRERWGLPASLSFTKFIAHLIDGGYLRRLELTSPYTTASRYISGPPSPFEIAQSLSRSAYLSHGTAAFLHGLTTESQLSLYLNKEQSEKPKQQASEMTQDAIDKAFTRHQRRSKNIFRYENYEINVLSGKHTGNLQVQSIKGPNNAQVRVTGIERTLADLAVRPAYAGGVANVLAAYQNATGKFSILRLYRILEQLDYRYPYHQAIGFYLTKSGFPQSEIAVFKRLPIQFKFYLDYALEDLTLDPEWQVYYPTGAPI